MSQGLLVGLWDRQDTGTTAKFGSPWYVPRLPMGLWDRQDTGTTAKFGSPWYVPRLPMGLWDRQDTGTTAESSLTVLKYVLKHHLLFMLDPKRTPITRNSQVPDRHNPTWFYQLSITMLGRVSDKNLT